MINVRTLNLKHLAIVLSVPLGLYGAWLLGGFVDNTTPISAPQVIARVALGLLVISLAALAVGLVIAVFAVSVGLMNYVFPKSK